MGCAKCLCCGYPNGAVQVIAMQFLLFCGVAFSWAALGDCKFVTTSASPSDIDDDDLATVLPAGRGLGYFMFESDNGDCAWNEIKNYDQYESYYYSFLGSDWKTGRAFGVIAGALAIFVWIWSLFMICLPHSRPARYVLILLLLIIVVFQGLTFLPFGTGFCSDLDCQFSRSAGLSVGAMLCYFFSGALIFFMRDYVEPMGEKVVVVTATPPPEEALADEEEPVVEQDEVDEEEDTAAEEEEDTAAEEEEDQEKDEEDQDEESPTNKETQEKAQAEEETTKETEVKGKEDESRHDKVATNESIEFP